MLACGIEDHRRIEVESSPQQTIRDGAVSGCTALANRCVSAIVIAGRDALDPATTQRELAADFDGVAASKRPAGELHQTHGDLALALKRRAFADEHGPALDFNRCVKLHCDTVTGGSLAGGSIADV